MSLSSTRNRSDSLAVLLFLGYLRYMYPQRGTSDTNNVHHQTWLKNFIVRCTGSALLSSSITETRGVRLAALAVRSLLPMVAVVPTPLLSRLHSRKPCRYPSRRSWRDAGMPLRQPYRLVRRVVDALPDSCRMRSCSRSVKPASAHHPPAYWRSTSQVLCFFMLPSLISAQLTVWAATPTFLPSRLLPWLPRLRSAAAVNQPHKLCLLLPVCMLLPPMTASC